MANNYIQFSTLIKCDDEQAEWLCENLAGIEPQELSNEQLEAMTDEEIEAMENEEYDDDDRADACRFERESDGVWLSSDESFYVDRTCSVLAAMQTKFNLTEPIMIEWAETCSRPVLDQFGGGGCLIYKGETHYFVPSTLMSAKLAEIKAQESGQNG